MADVDLAEFSASPQDVAGFYTEHPPKKRGRTKGSRDRTKEPLPKPAAGARYIKGPVPLDWLSAASVCGSRADAVAVLIWFAAGYQKTNPVVLYPDLLAVLRVHPRTAKRTLERMVHTGLIKAEFHRGRSPRVTILELPDSLESA